MYYDYNAYISYLPRWIRTLEYQLINRAVHAVPFALPAMTHKAALLLTYASQTVFGYAQEASTTKDSARNINHMLN